MIVRLLSPDLDLAREFRWAMVEETYGEDSSDKPHGSSVYKGFYPNNIVCTPKHFIAHGSAAGGLNLTAVAGGEKEL